MSKYVDLLNQTKEEQNKALAPARADEQKGRLGLEISTRKLGLVTAQNALASLKNQYPLNLDAIQEAADALEWNERQVAQLETLSTELFS